MTEARWKLVVDGQSVTIASDRFQFTTNGAQSALDDLEVDDAAESSQIEAIVSELQTMTRRTYGQFCGLSRALEIIGERWALLIIRDLLVGPKKVADLQRGLPRMAIDILGTRLNEMERTGVVRRSVSPDETGAAVYELTEWGKELEDIVYRLSRWGTRLLEDPRPEDIVTPDSMVMALRSTFRPEAARGLTANYELRLGEIVIHARIEDGVLSAAEGAIPDADLVIEPGMVLRSLMAGEIEPAEAIENGSVQLSGDPGLLTRFVDAFRISGPPEQSG
jgi:DNA-binding HxlR family transcriptional regulator